MEWEPDSPRHSHTYPGQGCRSPGRHSGWELEFRDCVAIPGWGLLSTAERWIERIWGRRLWWEWLWRKARQPWKQGDTVESHVGGGAITITFLSPPTSISSWNNREADPSHTWGTELQSRPQPGDPSMCLMCQTTERDPRQGIPLSAWMVRATKTGQRSLLIASYKSLKKRLR